MLAVLNWGWFWPQEHLALSVNVFDCQDWDKGWYSFLLGRRSGMPLDIIQWIQQSSDPKCQWETSYVNENYMRTVFETLMLPGYGKATHHVLVELIKDARGKRGVTKVFLWKFFTKQMKSCSSVEYSQLIFMKQAGSVCSYNLSHSVGISFLIFYQWVCWSCFQSKSTFDCGWQGFTLAFGFWNWFPETLLNFIHFKKHSSIK